MGESINKAFEDYQKDLRNREKNLKYIMSFDTDETLEEMTKELKNKEIVL